MAMFSVSALVPADSAKHVVLIRLPGIGPCAAPDSFHRVKLCYQFQAGRYDKIRAYAQSLEKEGRAGIRYPPDPGLLCNHH